MSIGFKEWAVVCDTLGSGDQSIILRKGGIAEGRDGFRFKHAEFLLFPTLFHEQISKTKLPSNTPLPAHVEGIIRIQYAAKVEWTAQITDWELVRKLDPFHIWTEETIRERFLYDDEQGVSLAFLRIYKLDPAHEFPDAPKYGGCRSWVELPEPALDTKQIAVISDEIHAEREKILRAIVGDLVGI